MQFFFIQTTGTLDGQNAMAPAAAEKFADY